MIARLIVLFLVSLAATAAFPQQSTREAVSNYVVAVAKLTRLISEPEAERGVREMDNVKDSLYQVIGVSPDATVGDIEVSAIR